MPDTETLTEEQLKEIEARADAASIGPWSWSYHPKHKEYVIALESGDDKTDVLLCTADPSDDSAYGFIDYHDAAIIAHAREDIPALCRSLKAAWAENQRLRELVYVPKIAPDDADLTYADEVARLLREKVALSEQLATQAESIITFQEQLKEAHANVESLSQIIFRSEHAIAMRDACVEKVKQVLEGLMIELPPVSDSYLKGQGWNSAIARANNELMPALQSLTLENQ